MMAAAGPPSTSGFLPLLETLEDDAAGEAEQIDAYLTIANRLSGDDGRHFLLEVEKHFPRLGKVFLVHIGSASKELSHAALQALGFCMFYSQVALCVSDVLAAEILSALCSLISKTTKKNTCTRALWVISKQSFPADVVGKNVPMVLSSLESIWNRSTVPSVVMEHEAINVIIKLLEQVPTQMGEGAVRWAKLVIPLVVHSASKVRLRAAAAMEMGLPMLLTQQADVAAAIEPVMASKLIPELQKLFMSKNETNVLKLWPLFVKLLGKLLHRGGPFINSLLHLEELGFRSSSPTVKKIAFIAWKSLIDNFALNPEILCSSKRMKLLLQPFLSIHVRTEALLLTKVEVWWYLVVQLGPNLSSQFDQVSVPLLQSMFGSCSSSGPGTPPSSGHNGSSVPGTPKSGNSTFTSLAITPRMSLGSSMPAASTFPSIQLLGLEMLLHYLVGPEVVACAAKNKLVLSLEPLTHSLLAGASSFTKHAAVLVSTITVGFTSIGKDAPESLLAIIWTRLVRFVSMTIESSSKKERQGGEVLTSMLQALQSIAETLPADRLLVLLERTVKNIPPRVLGSTSYQVGKMDVLNGTPALFLILLVFDSSNLPAFVEDERFLVCLQTLITCGLSGPTSPLAFVEAVLGAISRSTSSVLKKEQQWRLWSSLVGLLTDTITQSNEVNQGDALEHNFSAIHSALMFPITHLLGGASLPQAAQKSMLSSWSKLYKVFARCSALVVTAEENICCEELCSKMAAAVDREALKVPSTLNAIASILHVMVECVDFSPYTPQFQQKLKSPHTPMNWARKQSKALGNLSSFQVLLVQCLHAHLEAVEESSEATGSTLLSILSVLFTNLALTSAIKEALTSVLQPLVLLYEQASGFPTQLLEKLEKLLGDVLGCLQTHCALAYDSELLAQLTPLLCVLFLHKNKHLRTAVTHFWNATFANSVSLTYPEEIRPVLSQVKKKTPIILPGFEAVTVPDELSEQFSSESSQLETKLSGIPVSSAGKRDSMLGKASELKDRSSRKPNKPVSTKLDFDSPRSRNVLEEEASTDFVFIPPETKERVLTEHQKEMKRTRRVDIPVMYNNLDASLDTTVFSQYTQSQEDPDKAAAKQNVGGTEETPDEIPPKNEEDKDVLMQELQERDSTADTETTGSPAQILQDSEKVEEATDNVESKNDTSPNVSSSSDLVLGTPQKLSSRRQSFITLEKYSDGKPASPSSSSSFPGPHVSCSSQKASSEASACLGSQDSDPKPSPPDPESPRRPKDCRAKAEPVRLIERLPEDSSEDAGVIPDMQNEKESGDLIPKETNMKEEPMSEDSPTQTSTEQPRRSGRQRIRPQLPGEDPEEREAKFSHSKRRRSREETKSESPSRSEARTKPAAEESSGAEGPPIKSSRDSAELSQSTPKGKMGNVTKTFSFVDVFLEKPEPKKKRTSEPQSSRTQNDSLNSSPEAEISQESPDHTAADLHDGVNDQLSRTAAPQTDVEPQGMRPEHQDEELEPAEASETNEPSSNIERHSQEEEEEGSEICSRLKDNETEHQIQSENMITGEGGSEDSLGQDRPPVTPSSDSQMVTPSPDSQTVTPSPDSLPVTPSPDSQTVTPSPDSQTVTPSPDSQSRLVRKSRRSDPLSETGEFQDNSQHMESVGPRRRSQTALAKELEAESKGVRTRSRKTLQEPLKSSPKSTPKSSQSLDLSGSDTSQDLRRRSALKTGVTSESPKSASSEGQRTTSLGPQRRGRKPKVSRSSALESQESRSDVEMTESQEGKAQVAEAAETQNLQEPQREEESSTKTETCEVVGSASGAKTAGDGMVPSSEPEDQHALESAGLATPLIQDPDLSADDGVLVPQETEERLDVPESSEMSKEVSENTSMDFSTDHQESSGQEHPQEPPAPLPECGAESVSDAGTELGVAPVQDSNPDGQTLKGDAEASQVSVSKQTEMVLLDTDGAGQESPMRLKCQATEPDIGQSPRGAWSPSASPSTSILKKAQKRSLEVETPSPLVKSRRVSFANPIQQQETADDIDRRSLAVGTNSPRRSKGNTTSQSKLVTTPTKGLQVLSPRNLHSPGYKSSKKCLISEMGQEPGAVSRDCIYPALVGCSAPVEAVLSQISSTMWSRGFGQLVRARNIKTVGDISALTPAEIKTLPIRSPKISNVKKALKVFEQQRRGRGAELKGFDETERMTSELEEPDKEETTSAPLATEPVVQPVSSDVPPELDATALEGNRDPAQGLLGELEALSSRMTPMELSGFSPQQLMDMHAHLGGMMRSVVVEMQTRLQKL
ncbi:telomere-associated protein RIF1 isoform X2 [Oryzias melastigma]|uniref:Replication timing regulatory factor 1 n=1 Tax=Oryzias melastigma TaxID=30732 RepID=A0A3B3DX61_ORYME|nr:telomere-associated protein RIF1 isoform X2 [Oryzias melastigma]